MLERVARHKQDAEEDSSQVNLYICIALNHSYSLKGLYGPYIYDSP